MSGSDPISDRECWEAVTAVHQHGSWGKAGKALGVSKSTVGRRLKDAGARGIGLDWDGAQRETPVEKLANDLPSYEATKERVLGFNPSHIRDTLERRHIHLTVPHGVFLQFFVGDPHLDSPGCDYEQLMRDLDAIRAAQKEFACHTINMGDVLDNWPMVGKLGHKQHDTHLTRKEALSLVRGFVSEEGIDFTAHILGNHDAWPGVDFATLIGQWTAAPVIDWGCFLHVKTAIGWEFKTFAAHDMRGSSIHNPIHGLARRGKEDGEWDLYVAAHRHNDGQSKDQNGFRDRTYSYMRVRGYKRADEYAWRKGFPEVAEGCTGLAVINPNAKLKDSICRTFYDLEEGLDFARMLKAKE